MIWKSHINNGQYLCRQGQRPCFPMPGAVCAGEAGPGRGRPQRPLHRRVLPGRSSCAIQGNNCCIWLPYSFLLLFIAFLIFLIYKGWFPYHKCAGRVGLLGHGAFEAGGGARRQDEPQAAPGRPQVQLRLSTWSFFAVNAEHKHNRPFSAWLYLLHNCALYQICIHVTMNWIHWFICLIGWLIVRLNNWFIGLFVCWLGL